MGLWAGIKRSLNSTVGTTEFEPLDKIIKGAKGLKASDNFYSRILSGNFSGTADSPFVIENLIEMKWQGSFRMKIRARAQTNTGYVNIKKNGSIVFSLALDAVSNYTEYSQDISFTNGDIIGVEISGIKSSYGDGIAYLRYIDIYADVIDMSAFKNNYMG